MSTTLRFRNFGGALAETTAMRPDRSFSAPTLRGLITDADLATAEQEWPGLQEFLWDLPAAERPPTFLQLVWLFESCRCDRRAA